MRPGEAAPVHGNREVVKFLEEWLEEARLGEINHVTLTACKNPNEYCAEYIGCLEMDPCVSEALAALHKKLDYFRLNRKIPERPRSTADHVIFNAAEGPMSWDFLIWLIECEMTRILEGAPAPLKVSYFFGRDGKTGIIGEYRQQMFQYVCRPLLQLIGAVEEKEHIGRDESLYVPRNIVMRSRAGEPVPLLKTPTYAVEQMGKWLGGRQPITITLREAEHWPHRNNDLEAWSRFARDLAQRGEWVIFVRDTCKADEPLPGFDTCPAASVYVEMRLALYEAAKCNLFVGNGPAGLALFGTRPYLYFQQCSEQDSYSANRPSFWIESNGLRVGDQWPWARPDQRMIYKTDSYENLCAAWEEFQPILLEKAA